VRIGGEMLGRIVEADRAHLDLLLGNLLENAHKYSPPDEVIDVALASLDRTLEVRVLDRGIGFTPEEAGELFSTFYRTDSAKRMSSGLGIGLSACRRLVELLGGRIWAVPRPDGGSEFGFALPAAIEMVE
jgi:signal transduction histidine kinase